MHRDLRQVLHATTPRTLVEAANADMFLSLVKLGDTVFATLESARRALAIAFFFLSITTLRKADFAREGWR